MAHPRLPPTKKSSSNVGLRLGFRSGLEKRIAGELATAGVPVRFEEEKLEYVDDTVHKYTPDFRLPNGIFIETKGRFLPADRTKHLHVKRCNPEVDIRFVFQRSASPLYKGSKTTYADWCVKHGFLYADKSIPTNWIKEKKCVKKT